MSSENFGGDQARPPMGPQFGSSQQSHESGFHCPAPAPRTISSAARPAADRGATLMGLAAFAATGVICVGAFTSAPASLLLFICSAVVCAAAVWTTSRVPMLGLLPRALIGGSFAATVATAWAVSEGLAL